MKYFLSGSFQSKMKSFKLFNTDDSILFIFIHTNNNMLPSHFVTSFLCFAPYKIGPTGACFLSTKYLILYHHTYFSQDTWDIVNI